MFQTVFRETLWGEKFFARMAELQSQGAKIETMSRSKEGNAVWEIVYRLTTHLSPSAS